MKKMLTQKILRLLMNWLRSRFAPRFQGKSKFGNPKPDKKKSPKYFHLLKVSRLAKNNFRQKGWKVTSETTTSARAAEIIRLVRGGRESGSGDFSNPAQK